MKFSALPKNNEQDFWGTSPSLKMISVPFTYYVKIGLALG